MCAWLRPTANAIEVLILQHPLEAHQAKGSARLLGYLNAYLALSLEVEHQSGSDMKGRGRIDIEIEICWCYSVRVTRTVEQTI